MSTNMGTWAAPWESGDTAEAFAERMSRPWVAVVTRVRRPVWDLREGDRLEVTEDGTEVLLRRQGAFRRWRTVPPDRMEDQVDWDAEGLYGLLGDDELFDVLGDHAEDIREDFDCRPWVRARLAAILTEFGEDLFDKQNADIKDILMAVLDDKGSTSGGHEQE